MRFLLLALMLLGLLTGGPVRAAECSDCLPVSDCCSDSHGQQGHSEGQCPEGHHHHSICCHVSPLLAAEVENEFLLRSFITAQPSFRPQSDRVPEGPFLSSEKPPLI